MMSPIEAIASVLSKPVTFSGRASRAEYWWFSLFHFLATFVLIFVDVLRISRNSDAFVGIQQSELTGAIFSLVTVWFVVLMVLPYLALTVRRLHDIGLSGLVFLVSFIPIIGSLIILVLMVWPGQTVANSHGDPWNRFGGRAKAARGSHPFSQAVSTEQQQAIEVDRKAEIRALYEQRVLGGAS